MLRRLLSLVIIMSGLLPRAAASGPLPALIDEIRPSVVAVGTHAAANRPPARFRGTGFVVGDGRFVVTNYHVLPPSLDSKSLEHIAVFSGRGRNVVMHPARLEVADPAHDLALLRIDGEPLPAVQIAETAALREGDEIAFTGFPIGTVLGLHPVTHRGIVSALTPVVIPTPSAQQLTARMVRAIGEPYDVLQLDATAYPGNSGSPVFAVESGKVVGVVNMVFVKSTKEASLSAPSGITYAMPARYVQALLKQAQKR